MAVAVEYVDTVASGNVLFRSAASLRDVDTGEALAKWVRHELQAVFPHAAFLFGLWRIRPAGMAPVKYYAWNLPVEHLPAYRQPDGLYHAALLHGWLKRGEPVLLDATCTPTVAAAMSNSGFVLSSARCHFDIQRFHTLPCPWGPAKKLETRLDAGVMGEAADLDFSPQRLPAMECNQFVQYLLKRDAVERVVGLNLSHGLAGPMETKRRRL